MSLSRGSSQLRNWTWVSCIVGRFFTTEPSGKPTAYLISHLKKNKNLPYSHISLPLSGHSCVSLFKSVACMLSPLPFPPWSLFTTFYFKIISNLQKNCNNNTDISHVQPDLSTVVQIFPYVLFCVRVFMHERVCIVDNILLKTHHLASRNHLLLVLYCWLFLSFLCGVLFTIKASWC